VAGWWVEIAQSEDLASEVIAVRHREINRSGCIDVGGKAT